MSVKSRGIREPSFHWILVDIFRVRIEIALIADLMFRESGMPHGETQAEFLADLVRRATLNQLHGLLESCRFSGRENHVHVIGHHDMVVDLEATLIAMLEDSVLDNRCHLRVLKEGSALPRVRGHEVGRAGLRAMFWPGHGFRG